MLTEDERHHAAQEILRARHHPVESRGRSDRLPAQDPQVRKLFLDEK